MPPPNRVSCRSIACISPERAHVCMYGAQEGDLWRVVRSRPSRCLRCCYLCMCIRARRRAIFYHQLYNLIGFASYRRLLFIRPHPLLATRGCGDSIPDRDDAVATGGPANLLQEPGVYAEDEGRGGGGSGGGGDRPGLTTRGRKEEDLVVDVDVRLAAGEGEGRGLIGWHPLVVFSVMGARFSLW